MDEKKERFLKAAPKLREKEKDKLNGLFQAFLFRRSKTREVWTTCCRQHRVIVPGNSAEEDRLLHEPHTPEPIERQYWREPVNKWEANRRIRCPWCGAEAKLKELGRCGNRKNISSYKRAVVLRQYHGKLWVMAYDMGKDYTDTDRLGTQKLTQLPYIHLIGLYRFESEKAEGMKSYWWDPTFWGSIDTVTRPGEKRKWLLSSPFGFSQDYGMGYDVVGMEELEKSVFRYCRIPQLQKSCDLLRLLTLCCFYPRQVEFLAKLNLDKIISDYTERGVKSSGAVKWDARSHKDFIGMSVKEAMEIEACGGGAGVIATYRKLKGTKAEATIRECVEFEETFRGKAKQTIRAKMKAYETTQQIRQAEDARFNIQKTIKSTIRRYGATNKEVAHAKSIAEGIDSYFDVPESCRFHVVSELAGLYMDERMAGNNLVSQRKIAIKTALLDKAIEMFPKDKQIQENPDLFNPTKLLTMNYRTPERNMRKIFGDELGGQIYDYYFAPVQANEAERTRWMQKQFDEVRRFRGEDGKLKKLNKAESAYTHELLDLQSYVEKADASEKKSEILKAAEKLRRLQNEGKVDKNTRWDLAVEFDLDREQSEWMMKYAQWLTMKEGKPESVDETKCMEAAKKYREMFDNYFDAINDFLVSHGGQPIGKIEGYAPHISLNEKVNLLNQILQEYPKTDVMEMPWN